MKEKDLLTALSPGVHLWLIPPLEISSWSKRIDWYLGFQIQRSGPHRTRLLPPELTAVVDEHEVQIPKFDFSRQSELPLMVASDALLPNHQTVVVPFQSMTEWSKSCHAVWQKLDRPTVRVFLPKSAKVSDFASHWPKADGEHVEIVPEIVPENGPKS